MSALIGEMYKQSGKINIHGRIAYAPQQPWIQNASIRDNILFGLPYEEARYNKAISLCCLKTDLEQFQTGDLTEIGEKVKLLTQIKDLNSINLLFTY
jgi:ATP-binding cassette subfamily C (CFTR/MRP) protein 1